MRGERSVSRAGYQRAGALHNGRNVVHEVGHLFYASPPNGSNQCTRSVHMRQNPNPVSLFPSPPSLLPLSIPSFSCRGRISCGPPSLYPRQSMAPREGACGRGCAPVPNLIWGRGLSERSEFRSPNHSGLGQRHPKGRARAPMILGPFAETKGPRRAGPRPRKSFPPPQALGVTVKRRVPMRVTALASYPTKMSTR